MLCGAHPGAAAEPGENAVLLLCFKLPSCPSRRACHALLPHGLRSSLPELLGAVRNHVLFPHMSLLGETKQRAKRESSELSQPLLSKQGPLLFSEGTADMKLRLAALSNSSLPPRGIREASGD